MDGGVGYGDTAVSSRWKSKSEANTAGDQLAGLAGKIGRSSLERESGTVFFSHGACRRVYGNAVTTAGV
jgi:hypothetical protein